MLFNESETIRVTKPSGLKKHFDLHVRTRNHLEIEVLRLEIDQMP